MNRAAPGNLLRYWQWQRLATTWQNSPEKPLLHRLSRRALTTEAATYNADFAQEVYQGLSQSPKRLPTKFIYNEKGDELWRRVMALPTHYYLTKCEFEIFSEQARAITEAFTRVGCPFQLVEFGSGDGLKTKLLLRQLVQDQVDFSYVPVDISGAVLDLLQFSLKREIPSLAVEPMEAEYFQAFARLRDEKTRKVGMFIGSTVSNFERHEAVEFFRGISQHFNKGDLMLVGFDLKKDPVVLLQAYQDPEGAFGAFCMNLLHRINEDLGGNFDMSAFQYSADYHVLSGKASMNAVSCKDQTVYIEALDRTFDFEAWEAVSLLVAQKYSLGDIDALAKEAGFEPVTKFFDSRRYFVDALWTVV